MMSVTECSLRMQAAVLGASGDRLCRENLRVLAESAAKIGAILRYFAPCVPAFQRNADGSPSVGPAVPGLVGGQRSRGG